MIGDSNNIVERVKRLIPNRWFSYVAPYRDAIVGGIADLSAWNYKLIGYARAQTRLATAYGIWLDILCYDFTGRYLTRNGLQDDAFRALIKATILQERVTRAGMIYAITTLTGNEPWIFEPWNTYDTGAYSSRTRGHKYGSMGYGVGRGGYGNMKLNHQVFIKVKRSASSGVPGIGGYGSKISGYGTGRSEYIGRFITPIGVTNELIYKLINLTKPTGTIAWVQIS